jgi:hypothetical protein
MHLRKIYIRYKEDVPESANLYAALEGFRQLGVETAPFYGFGDIEELPDLGPEVGITGYVGDTHKALVKLGKPLPEVLDYPPELQDFIRREIRQTTLEEVRESIGPLFVKPVQHKLFTGFVWTKSRADRFRIAIHPNHTPVWVCRALDFTSEFRTFVLDGEILDVRRYKGDWSDAPFKGWVEDAVKAYKSAPRAYSLDFGVTFGGRTLLIEVNDSFALGHYGMASIPYARMIDARWEEMTR